MQALDDYLGEGCKRKTHGGRAGYRDNYEDLKLETQTLEDLKAENAAEEIESVVAPETTTEDVEAEASNEEVLESGESAETDETEGTDAEPEAWMAGPDEQESETSDEVYSDRDIAAVRRKFKAKLEKATENSAEEIAKLKAQVEALSKQSSSSAPAEGIPMPTLEGSDFDEGKHAIAMEKWIEAKLEAKVSVTSQTQAQQLQAQKAQETLIKNVDAHYERAITLSKESGIAPDVYQKSDLEVRQALEAVAPNQGDMITDQLISRAGEGSEKVMYFLGRNPAELAKLQGMVASDPSGLTAAMHIGELKGRVAAPKKQVSNARKPATTAQGDASGTESGNAKAMLKKYKEAHKAGNNQVAFDTRRAAKKAGLDVSNW